LRIYGINPVVEALRARRVTAVRVSPRADERLAEIVRLAGVNGGHSISCLMRQRIFIPTAVQSRL
jgi:hypothetical protein